MSTVGPIIPQRYAGLPVCGIDGGDVACHVSFHLRPADYELSANEFRQRLLDPAEMVLADEIDRRGRHSFIGVAFTEALHEGAPVLMVSALRQR